MTPKVYKYLESGLLVTISLLKPTMRPESLSKKTRSVANISSEYPSLVVSERSLEFFTLFLIVHTHLTLKLTFF